MAAVGANDVAEQRPPPEYHVVEDHPTCTWVHQRCSSEFQKTAKVYPPSVKRFAADNDLSLSHNSPMGMQDLGASRETLPSSFAFSLPPMGSGGERPTHEEATEAVELERIQVLTRHRLLLPRGLQRFASLSASSKSSRRMQLRSRATLLGVRKWKAVLMSLASHGYLLLLLLFTTLTTDY